MGVEIWKGEGWGVLVGGIRNSSANSVNQTSELTEEFRMGRWVVDSSGTAWTLQIITLLCFRKAP